MPLTRRVLIRRALVAPLGFLLGRAMAEADQVIITTGRDDSNVLAALTVRQLNPDWKPSRLSFSNRRLSSPTGKPHSVS